MDKRNVVYTLNAILFNKTKNGPEVNATICINFKNIMLNERTQDIKK